MTTDIASKVIFCLGGVFADTVFHVANIPTTPTKVFASRSLECVGGIAGNAARTIRKLGAQVRLVGVIGSDAAASMILAMLAEEGVGASDLKRMPGGSGRAAVAIGEDAERSILVSVPPTLALTAADVRKIDFSGGDALFADWRWAEAAEYALGVFRRAGKPAVLDADIGPSPIRESLVAAATHVIFSRQGLAQFTGEDDVARGLRLAAARTTATVGATDGSRGCQIFNRASGTVTTIPAPQVTAVDTLAAGDVFHGAYTLALAAGLSDEAAVVYASAVAASKVKGYGLATLISHEEALAAVRRG